MTERVCAQCGKPLPADAHVLRRFCDVRCRDRATRERTREQRAERNKRWREANAETLAEKKRAHREANRDRYKAWDRARYLRDRDKMIDQAKENYAKNREKRKAQVRANLDKKRQDPAWMAKERERGRQKWHKATEEQREAWRRRTQRRQSRKNLQRVGEVSAADWDAILRIWNHSCAYCGTRLEYNEHGNLVCDIEHIIPISRGGPHSVGNLVPSCEGCNHRKSNKLLVEWRYSALGMKRLANGPLGPITSKPRLP